MGLSDTYARAVWDGDGVLATWLPDRRLRVGDVVRRDPRGGALSVEGQLDELVEPGGLPLPVQRAGASRVALQDGVDFGLDASVGVGASAVVARFERDRSFLMVAEGGSISEYPALGPVRRAVDAAHVRGAWDLSWTVVTSVRSFAALTLVVAETEGAAVQLETGESGPSLPARVRGGGRVQVLSGRAATWSLADSTPLFEGMVVRRRLVRGDVVGPDYLSGGSVAETAGDAVTEVVRASPTLSETGSAS